MPFTASPRPAPPFASTPASYEKVQFGCFKSMFKGDPPWLNTDILPMEEFAKAGGYHFARVDVRKPLRAWPDGSVRLIYHSHLIEHLSFYQGVEFLAECRRILKPGGVMRVCTPDLRVLLLAWMRDYEFPEGTGPVPGMETFNDAQPELYRKVKSPDLKLAFILWGNLDPRLTQQNYGGHWLVYSFESLSEVLTIAGWKEKKVERRVWTEQERNVARDSKDSVVVTGPESFLISSVPEFMLETHDQWPDHSFVLEVQKEA